MPRRARCRLSAEEIIAALPLLSREDSNRVCNAILNDPVSLARKIVDAQGKLLEQSKLLDLRLTAGEMTRADWFMVLAIGEQVTTALDGAMHEIRERDRKLARRKAEYEERDAEIVRLRDEERWPFPRIAKHFDMERDAARAAYWRLKQPPSATGEVSRDS